MVQYSITKTEYSAGGVVARRIGDLINFLIIKDPYGNWGLPKGHIENGESSEEAAIREVSEETGLCELSLGPSLGTIDWHFRTNENLVHKFCEFFFIISRKGEARPQLEEAITECLWLPVQDAIVNVTYDNARQVMKRAAEMVESDEITVPL